MKGASLSAKLASKPTLKQGEILACPSQAASSIGRPPFAGGLSIARPPPDKRPLQNLSPPRSPCFRAGPPAFWTSRSSGPIIGPSRLASGGGRSSGPLVGASRLASGRARSDSRLASGGYLLTMPCHTWPSRRASRSPPTHLLFLWGLFARGSCWAAHAIYRVLFNKVASHLGVFIL